VLTEPERTPYDLRFRLLGFPVRVHPWFWVLAALLGAETINLGLQFLAIWVAVVFASILVHELGHAVAFRAFGSDADIVLYSFGGLAVPTSHVAGRGRRVLVSLAGPLAGFALCALVYGSNRAFHWATDEEGFAARGLELAFFYGALVTVNLYWGILNLLPIFPLDGGQVSREVCGKFWGSRGRRLSLQVSFAAALVIVAYSLLCAMDGRGMGAGVTGRLPWWVPRGSVWTAILFGLLAMSSYQMLQQPDYSESPWDDDRPPWSR
jgi:Zn-dependent protease